MFEKTKNIENLLNFRFHFDFQFDFQFDFHFDFHFDFNFINVCIQKSKQMCYKCVTNVLQMYNLCISFPTFCNCKHQIQI